MRRFWTTSNFIGMALAGLVLFAAAPGARAQTRELATQGELLDRVVAIVNDGVVLNSDLDAQVSAVRPSPWLAVEPMPWPAS